jgi:membrane protein insertase Oxa1/YidC/SpoIIIJ
MTLWNGAVEILREAMFAYAHATSGNLAAGILTVTFLARLALFPLMLRVSRAAAADPKKMTLGRVAGTLAPAPVLIALYSAVRQCAAVGGRFLWIADISRPDRLLATIVAAIAVGAAALAPVPEGQSRTLMTLLPAVITMIVLWKMAAGVGLYWGLSSAVGAAQVVLTNRGRRA